MVNQSEIEQYIKHVTLKLSWRDLYLKNQCARVELHLDNSGLLEKWREPSRYNHSKETENQAFQQYRNFIEFCLNSQEYRDLNSRPKILFLRDIVQSYSPFPASEEILKHFFFAIEGERGFDSPEYWEIPWRTLHHWQSLVEQFNISKAKMAGVLLGVLLVHHKYTVEKNSGETLPYSTLINRLTGISPKTVKKHLDGLHELGVITIQLNDTKSKIQVNSAEHSGDKKTPLPMVSKAEFDASIVSQTLKRKNSEGNPEYLPVYTKWGVRIPQKLSSFETILTLCFSEHHLLQLFDLWVQRPKRSIQTILHNAENFIQSGPESKFQAFFSKHYQQYYRAKPTLTHLANQKYNFDENKIRERFSKVERCRESVEVILSILWKIPVKDWDLVTVFVTIYFKLTVSKTRLARLRNELIRNGGFVLTTPEIFSIKTHRIFLIDYSIQNLTNLEKACIKPANGIVVLRCDISSADLTVLKWFLLHHYSLSTDTLTRLNIDRIATEISVDRDKVKMMVYRYLYGASDSTILENSTIDKAELSHFKNFFDSIPEIEHFRRKAIHTAKVEKLSIPTILGHRYPIYCRAITLGLCYPIQGSGVELLLEWILQLQNLNMTSKIVNVVHDEIYFNAHRDQLRIDLKRIERAFQRAVEKLLPGIQADITAFSGPTWSKKEMTPISF